MRLGAGGIGAMHELARRTGLTAAIDESLQPLKVHQPYHESDIGRHRGSP